MVQGLGMARPHGLGLGPGSPLPQCFPTTGAWGPGPLTGLEEEVPLPPGPARMLLLAPSCRFFPSVRSLADRLAGRAVIHAGQGPFALHPAPG